MKLSLPPNGPTLRKGKHDAVVLLAEMFWNWTGYIIPLNGALMLTDTGFYIGLYFAVSCKKQNPLC